MAILYSMPSRRLPASLEPNALSAELEACRRAGVPILDLTLSNPTRCGLPYPEAAIRACLAGPGVLDYRPDPRGRAQAREAIAAHHGHGLGADDLVLTASTSEAYSWLFKLLCDPGDDILVPAPSYPLFHWLAALEGVEARPVPALRHERWHLDLAGLEAARTARTRAVVVVNPNNPTGHFLDRAEWAALLAFCAGSGLALLVDEVFADYPLEPPASHLPTALETREPGCPLFVLSGLSKIAALPQVKLGWIAARGEPARALLEPLGFIADQYLSVSASAQAAAPELLRLAPSIQAGILARLRANLAQLDRALAAASAPGPAAGGRGLVGAAAPAGAGLGRSLRPAPAARSPGVSVHPGHFFDLPGEGYLVLSLLPPTDLFREGVGRLVGSLQG